MASQAPATTTVAASDLWTRFASKAELVGATVLRTESDARAAELLAEAAASYACTQSVTARFPRVAARGAVRLRHDLVTDQSTGGDDAPISTAASSGDAFGAAVAAEVVTAAVFGVAETGSLALDEPRADRGRCFLAERLWVLVPSDAVVATLDEALVRLHALVRHGAPHPLLMTGPSRTADIERTLTVGVHGPRALTVVVVGAA